MNSNDKTRDVVIVGGGPAGIGVALGLAKTGLSVLLLERSKDLGGIPFKYTPDGGMPTFFNWSQGRMMHGREFSTSLLKELRRTDTQVHSESLVLKIDKEQKSLSVLRPGEKYEVHARAAVLACGAREKSWAERGWITGSRPSRVFYTMNILDLSSRHKGAGCMHPVILGSDLVAFSAAAKLAHKGAEHPIMLDNGKMETNFLKRLYFKRWAEPKWLGPTSNATIEGLGKITSISTDGRQLSCDGAIISGDLIANSELALLAGLKGNTRNRKPSLRNKQQLSEPGWFAVGNVTGNIHGAYWCYLKGRLLARHIVGYLKA